MHIKATALFFAAGLLSAQQPTTNQPSPRQPVEVKRQPPGAKHEPTAAAPSLLQQYDFGAQVKALQDGVPFTLPEEIESQFVSPPTKGSDGVAVSATVPKDYKPRTDVPLTATALEAVRVSEKWRAEKNPPAAGSDGRVLYSFGAGLPTVVCAPLRVCMVELQAGEKIVGEPKSGILSAGTFPLHSTERAIKRHRSSCSSRKRQVSTQTSS